MGDGIVGKNKRKSDKSDALFVIPEITKFLNHLTLERRLSNYTVRNYQGALEKFNTWLKQNSHSNQLLEVNKDTARSYLIELQASLSRKSLSNHASGLRSFYQFCQIRKLTEHNPFKNIPLPKAEKSLPKFFTESQVQDLMRAALTIHEDSAHADFLGSRDEIILHLLYGGGLRVSEVVGLNHGDLELNNRLVRVRGKGGKERVCPIAESTALKISHFLKVHSRDNSLESPLLTNYNGKRLTTRWIQLMLKIALKELLFPVISPRTN